MSNFCGTPSYMRMKYDPEWKQFEAKMHSHDSQEAELAGEAFAETRANELRNSAQARRWEASRKEAWAKEKPEWKKKQLLEQKLERDRIIKELREGGNLMKGLKPRSGLLIVKPEKEELEGEIYIPNSVEYQSNTARVVRTSEPMLTTTGEVECPCKEGELVLIRNGSGLELKIKGVEHLLIRFDEVFGVVEE